MRTFHKRSTLLYNTYGGEDLLPPSLHLVFHFHPPPSSNIVPAEYKNILLKKSCSLGKLSLEKSARVHSCKNIISGSRIDSSSSHYTKLTLISDVEDQFATKIVKLYKHSLGSLTQSAMSSSSLLPPCTSTDLKTSRPTSFILPQELQEEPLTD